MLSKVACALPPAARSHGGQRVRQRRLHYLRHLLPPIAEAPEGARFARCVFELAAAGTQDYPSTFAKRYAVGFLQP
jgi:hypothetical protein